MLRFDAADLTRLMQQLFEAVGCRTGEATRIAHRLVEANLVGHDSHGVIRAPIYVEYVERDMVRPNQSLTVVYQTESLAIVDGNFGFGQVIGEQAMELGADLARRHGIAAVALRNSGHLGRIGDWPATLCDAGLASFHFVNTSGFGLLVAPFGGIDRRLSANPLAAGVPRTNDCHLILDISTCAIAEGKLKVARNQGRSVPDRCIIDSQGRPTTDPNDFYGEPQGALLPFGGHKGYGLSVMAEMFAGALTGNGCTNPSQNERLLNGMFSIIVDPERLPEELDYAAEVERFIAYVKSSRLAADAGAILMPGELEQRTRVSRLRDGIALDEKTWNSIVATCRRLDLDDPLIDSSD